MGIFDSVLKFTGIGNADKFTRTGATAAARAAQEAGQNYLGQQQAFQDELRGLYDGSMQYGNEALSRIADFYGGNQQKYYDQAQASPAYSNLVSQGENAIARNQQATGGFRSGTTQENLAQNSQNVLQGLVQQNLQGNQYLANYGGDSRNAYANAGAGILNQIGTTMGQNAQIGINQAANKQNMLTGLFNAGASIGGGLLSDERLKKDIIKTGTENGYNTYSWSWNELAADKFGLSGDSSGVIAQEVLKINPEAVIIDNGFMKVDYDLIGVNHGV